MTLDFAVESEARGRRDQTAAARGFPRTHAAEEGGGVCERGCGAGRAGGSEGASVGPARGLGLQRSPQKGFIVSRPLHTRFG